MTIATGSRRGLAYGTQTVFGTAATTTKLLRNTGASFNLSTNALDSSELREDRQIAVTRTGNKSASGEVPVEFMFSEYDELIAALVGSSWPTAPGPYNVTVGNTIPYFTFEDRFTDIGVYRVYKDCVVDKFDLTATPGDSGSYITGTFNVLGSGMTTSGSEIAVPSAANTSISFDTCDATLKGDFGAGLTNLTVVNSLDLSFANNMAQVFYLGKCSVGAIVPGKFEVTGSIGVMLEDDSWMGYVTSETEFELDLKFTDPDTNIFTINLPRVRVTNPQTGNQDQAIEQTMDVRALYDATDDTTVTFSHS